MSYTTIDCARCGSLFDVQEQLGGYDTLPITDASHPWWSEKDRRVRGNTYQAAYCSQCAADERREREREEDHSETLGDA